MTPATFRRWRETMGFSSQDRAAEALGVHQKTVRNWETGKVPKIPVPVQLAMSALYHNLEPWK